MNQVKIGNFIAECRKNKSYTQERLGELVGVSRKAVSKWECGKAMPDVSIWNILCEILEITPEELLMGENIRKERVIDDIYIDSITGLYNKRYFREQSKQLLSLLGRNLADLSLLIIDLDSFKKYNDIYGFNRGDACIREVAGIIAKTVKRELDFVARYSGCRFVVVLPYTCVKGVHKIASSILENIYNANILHEQGEINKRVTVSIGVVYGKIHHSQSIEEYVEFAEQMMLVSKQNGRNRYTITSFEKQKLKLN